MYKDIYFWSGGDQAMHHNSTIAVIMGHGIWFGFCLQFVCYKAPQRPQKRYNNNAMMSARSSANAKSIACDEK